MNQQVPPIVVMGVSGSGKTTIGQLLADRLEHEFIDGDSLHPKANKEKMAAGQALDDADREPWLELIGTKLAESNQRQAPPVIACSALKRSYRDLIRRLAPATVFIHLAGGPNLIRDRITARSHEYMPASLLNSQLATLEVPDPDEPVLSADIADSPEEIVSQLAARLTSPDAPRAAH